MEQKIFASFQNHLKSEIRSLKNKTKRFRLVGIKLPPQVSLYGSVICGSCGPVGVKGSNQLTHVETIVIWNSNLIFFILSEIVRFILLLSSIELVAEPIYSIKSSITFIRDFIFLQFGKHIIAIQKVTQ